MGESPSSDIPERVVALVEEGLSCHEAARRLRISAASAVRIMQRKKRTGDVKAASQGRPRRCRLDIVSDGLQRQVETQPDHHARTGGGAGCGTWPERNSGHAVLPPCSTDLNPIEMACSKLKAQLRWLKARTFDALFQSVAKTCDLFPPEQCRRNLFRAAGDGED